MHLPSAYETLEAHYGPFPCEHQVLAADTGFVRHMQEKLENRTAEVILVIQRPDGYVLVHTKPVYPPGTWRLPSGGIHPGEAPTAAALREAAEETGLEIQLERPLGLLTYDLYDQTIRVPFVSYLFLLVTPGGRPAPQDTDEEISGYRWIPPGDLEVVAEQLCCLPPFWRSWGAFRAPAHILAVGRLLG